jgi:integral membrane protein
MSIGWLRVVAIVEGISYLVLLGIAMPLKYAAGMPEAVRVVGMAHGILFVLLCAVLGVVWWRRRWSLARVAAVFASALVPVATFVMDRRLRRWAAEDGSTAV